MLDAVSGDDLGGKDEFELLNMLSDISGMEIPKSLGELKNKEVRFKTVCNKEDMASETEKFLC